MSSFSIPIIVTMVIFADVFENVYLKFFVPLENFSLIWRRHHCRWMRGLQILTCVRHLWPLSSAAGFFSVPYLPWHGASIYDDYLRVPITLTPNTSVWQWDCHCLVLRLRSVAAVEIPSFRLRGEHSNRLRHYLWNDGFLPKYFFSAFYFKHSPLNWRLNFWQKTECLQNCRFHRTIISNYSSEGKWKLDIKLFFCSWLTLTKRHILRLRRLVKQLLTKTLMI